MTPHFFIYFIFSYNSLIIYCSNPQVFSITQSIMLFQTIYLENTGLSLEATK